MIHLSEAAIQELRRLMSLRHHPILRLHLRAGGCQDWRYHLELVATPEPSDRVYTHQAIAIAIPTTQVIHLQDLQIDYAEDLMGGSFRFQNPSAQHTCSCGQSFQLGSERIT